MLTRVMAGFLVSLFCWVLAGYSAQAANQAPEKTQVTWYGHSAFKIVTPQKHVIWIDPWLENPLNPTGKQDVASVDQGDLILVSHGHFDHVGNAVEIAQKTHAKLVTTFDLGNALMAYAGFPKAQAGMDSLGNFGGTLPFFSGEIKITLIPAVHGSSISASSSENHPEYGGNPAGFLIAIKNGPTFYHTGDTDFFSDMALVSKYQPVDVMLACIGDHFTMDPVRAAEAVALVKPKKVIPMHYGTFPQVLTGNVPAFKMALQNKKMEQTLLPLQVKETFNF